MNETVALILHFRDYARTRKCLDSLLSENVRQALIVDNSEDAGASLALLSEDIHNWSSAGLKIAVERPKSNLGFSAGVNLGLACIGRRNSKACVLLLNNDATLVAGAHAALLKAIESKATAVASACMVHPSGTVTPFAHYHPLLALLSRRPIPGAYRYLSACCMLIPSALVEDHLFDEEFFFYGEDIELGWRLTALGIEQVPVPEAMVNHDGSASSRNGSMFYEYHINRAHWLLARKTAKNRGEYVAALVARIIILPLRSIIRSVRFLSLVPMRALVNATFDVACDQRKTLTPQA